MLTDEKTDLVARSNLPKCMGSMRDDRVSVGNSDPREFRNHLATWLADTIEVMGVAAVVPEIPSTPTKSDTNAGRDGTTTMDASTRRRPILAAPISRS
jgi:hypothetical protein